MNTQRSQKKAGEFLKSGLGLKRKTQVVSRKFSHPPAKVFNQFCPSRELDWIPGWQCDLLYTTTGYAEKDCIFTTPESNVFGPGLWIFTNFEMDRELGAVVVNQSMVEHLRISLEDHGDGTCTGTWNLSFTALDEEGNTFLDSLPERNPELEQVVEGLEYFLNHGEMMSAA
jgi:hypothetical protein